MEKYVNDSGVTGASRSYSDCSVREFAGRRNCLIAPPLPAIYVVSGVYVLAAEESLPLSPSPALSLPS